MKAKIKLCMGTHCTMMGSLNLQESLEDLQLEYPEQIEIEPVRCLKFCEDDKAPVAEINGKIITKASSEIIISEVMKIVG